MIGGEHGERLEVQQTAGTWFFRRNSQAGWTAASSQMVQVFEEQLCPRGGRHERDEGGTCVKCLDPPAAAGQAGGQEPRQ